MAEEAEGMEEEASADERAEDNPIEESPTEGKTLEEMVEASDREKPSNEEKNSGKRAEIKNKGYYSKSTTTYKSNGERRADDINGVGAIFWYKDEKTGKVYFSLERKTRTHPKAGMYAFWGGHKLIGEPDNEAIVREVWEEDPKGYRIALNALRNNGYKLTELVQRVDGVISRTSVYVAQIKGAENWEKYISAKTSEEGDKAILTLKEVVAAIYSHSFAYPQQGDALEMLLRTGLQTNTQTGTHASSSHHAYSLLPAQNNYAQVHINSSHAYNNLQLHNPYQQHPINSTPLKNNNQVAGHIGPKYNSLDQVIRKAA